MTDKTFTEITMPLANYWNFLKSLRNLGETHSSSRGVRRRGDAARRRTAVSETPEALEVRIVPAALPLLTITPTVSAPEANADTHAAVFTVTLASASTNIVTVDFLTANGTAIEADNDYEPQTGTLTFAAGETTKTISIDVNGDTKREADESFNVILFHAINARLKKGKTTGTGTITNDDALPAASIGTPATVFEGNTGTKIITFPVTLTSASDQIVTLNFATANGTATVAGNDYNAASGTLTFAPGETTKDISVTIKGDTTAESDETLTVTLSAPTNATIATAVATGTIGDDDTTATLSVNNPASIDEGNTGNATLLFTVSLLTASTQTVTVAYATADGTATVADNDYTATTGTLTFAPGQTSKTVSVTVKGDTRNEAHETFTLVLSNPTNAIIAAPTGTATITNDDVGLPTVSVASGVTVTEGDSGTVDATFHVTLSQASGQVVTVAIATANGTATTADNDYTQKSATITFAPGETDKTFVVQVKGDTKLEGNETFTVNLTTPVNATIASAQRTGTITNDDTGFVSIAKTTDGAETTPATKGKFTVTQSGASATDTVVTYTVAGTAEAGADKDYQALSGTVTIPAGQTTAVINVNTLNDTVDEDTETVIVTLSGFTAHADTVSLDPDAADLTATVSILDASDVPSLVVGGPAVAFMKGDRPVTILPLLTVANTPLAGGTLSISVNAVTSSTGTANTHKLIDRVFIPATGPLGTSTGPQLVNGNLTLTIDLNQTVTTAQIQAFLRGLTFSTRKDGLLTAVRTMNITLSDAAHHSSTATQTINVS